MRLAEDKAQVPPLLCVQYTAATILSHIQQLKVRFLQPLLDFLEQKETAFR